MAEHNAVRSAPALVQRVLNSPAAALDSQTRTFFEARFGHDFSRVRVHSDAEAAASARAVDATAYTVGQHIAFDSGKFRPHTRDGQKLIAHELAHTVQQNRAATGIGHLPIGEPSDASEKEADRAASQALDNGMVSNQANRPLSLQRQLKPDASPGIQMPPSLDVGLAESASPFMASAIGSVTIDHFETGKPDISAANQKQLAHTAETILTLLKTYPGATISVTGHTDAVGQESDNQALGQARAEAAQASLVSLGIPAVSMNAESRGASALLVKTKKAEPRNRRVEVRFHPSRPVPHIMSPSANSTITPNSTPTQSPVPDLRKLGPNARTCIETPELCPQGMGGPRRPEAPPMTSLPSEIPYELMDVQGINDAYTSHGSKPASDLRATWGRIYLKYRYTYKLSRENAAKAANSELSGTAGTDQSRDNPNEVDRTNTDMKNAYPNSKGVGPFNLPWKLRF